MLNLIENFIKKKGGKMSTTKKSFKLTLTILIILLLLIISVPMSGIIQANPGTLNVAPFTLTTAGTGTAEWTTADKHTGSYSVKIYAPASSYAAVSTGAYAGTIDNITSLSFWYKHNPYAAWVGPRMLILVQKSDKYYLADTNCVVKSDTAWKKADAINGADSDFYVEEEDKNQIWGYSEANADGTPKEGATYTDSLTFADLQTALTGANVLGIGVYVSAASDEGPGGAYIDDIEVNGITYYGRIQDAVDSASDGDTINVAPGTYNERFIDINGRTNLTLKSTAGAAITIISARADSIYPGIYVRGSTGITIEGFTINDVILGADGEINEGASGEPWLMACVLIYDSQNCVVKDNIFYNFWFGVYLCGETGYGYSLPCTGNQVINNMMDGNNVARRGVYIYDNAADMLDNNSIVGNTIENCYQGIYLNGTSDGNLQILDNTITGSPDLVNYFPGNIYTDPPVELDNGIGIGFYGSKGAVLVEGNSISLCEKGIWVDSDSDYVDPTNVTVQFNNIKGNISYGILNENAITLDATNNWWGDVSGPGRHDRGVGVGYGTGDAVSANVDYDPWLDAPAPDGEEITFGDNVKEELTDTDPDTVDAKDIADTEVIKSGTGMPKVTIAEYSHNPGSSFTGGIGKYIEVHIDDASGVTELEIRLYYTNAEIAGLDENTLKMYWWNGTVWEACSDTGVNTTDIPGPPAYSGYIWAKIRSDTTPNLLQLEGTPFGGKGQRPIGGIAYPPNKFIILGSWLTLLFAILALAIIIWRRYRTQS